LAESLEVIQQAASAILSVLEVASNVDHSEEAA
jgi:hypothetical protein